MSRIENRDSATIVAGRQMRARALLDRILVWDNHACMPLRPHDTRFLSQLERHRAAGANVLILNVGFGEHGPEHHLQMLATFRAWLSDRPHEYHIIETLADIETAKAQGKLAIGFDIEGANAIADRIELIGQYHELGVRWMLMVYNRNNRVGGGCQDDDRGLTDFGRRVLEEMASVGMVACCSHTGERTAREIIDASPTPVIFSHSNPRALHDHPRNIPDDLIRACAERGGVIGINGIGMFLGRNDASVATFARHVEYVADLVGVAHVGIGLDYVFDQQELDEYISSHPDIFPAHLGYSKGMQMVQPEQLPQITEALLERGFDEEEVAAVLGGNWLRHAQRVWRS